MMNKENIVCYCQPPISKGVQFIHSEMFNIIEVLKTKFDVYVVARSNACYSWYLEEFSSRFPDVTFIETPDNCDSATYHYGPLAESIRCSVKGKIDNVFVFSAGMQIVTPIEKLTLEFETSEDNETVALGDPLDAAICNEAEFLRTVIEYQPKFFNRVVDYTEVDIEKVTGYPMKKFFYYTTPELEKEGFHKLHDSELFFNLGFKKDVKKTLDFMYGWTVEVPERAYLSDFCFTHIKQNDKVKLFCKDKHFSKYAPIETQLDSDKYYEVVSSAKFSLIAPSTTVQNVPLFRIYEDLSLQTIPIFMKTVMLEKAFDEETSQFIRENLTYDEDEEPDFNRFLESLDYDSLWQKLMSLTEMKQNMNRNWIFEKILEELV